MQFRSACRDCGMAKLLRFPEGNQVNVYHVPSEVKATAAERVLKQALNRIDLPNL